MKRRFDGAAAGKPAPDTGCACGVKSASAPAKITLFTTSTCPNCRQAKYFLDKANIAYDVVVSDQEPERAKEFDIRQAPTLVVDRGGVPEKIVNLSNIRRFVDETVQAAID
ncbi:MAG: glutaredoxin family protein [Victivallaceae bacterium]|nr:glutaredoxin family protein [Victivallaceae bacterium]